MKTCVPWFIAAVICTSAALPGFAWGPVTEQAIVTTAVHVLSREGTVNLTKLQKDVRNGATAPLDVVAKLYPGLASGPVRAIESEMYVLQRVRGPVLDPYFAYRLGMVGRLVAQITAPLVDESPVRRDPYYADVDAVIGRVHLKPSARQAVDPVPYFERAQHLANSHKEMIVNDYSSGVGFDGVAKAALDVDASHSVDAVADVWHTILTGSAAHGTISDSQIREYVVAAMGFYCSRGNETEIEAHYRRLSELTPVTPEMAKRIGDMFYEVGLYERAIREYQAVLAQDPRRKDVVEKIAAYYVQTGDAMAEDKRLEQAHEAYARAAQANPLHPSAEGKRLQTQARIAERDARLGKMRKNLEDAAKLESQAEELTLEASYAEAFGVLKQAQALYEEVTDEFMVEFQAAEAGLLGISDRLTQLRDKLIENAQRLSGSSFVFEARRMGANTPKSLDEQALRALAAHQYDAEMNALKKELQADEATP